MQNIEEAKRALTYLDADRERAYWIKIGGALKTEYGEDLGFQLWSDWSKNSDRYNEKEARYQWSKILAGKVNIGTLYFEAQNNGFEYNKENFKIPNKEEMKAKELEINKNLAIAEAEKKEAQKEAAIKANERWNNGKPLSDNNQYLKNKGIDKVDFLKKYLKEDDKNNLLIPIRKNNKLVGTQRITYTGGKFLEKNMDLSGSSLFMGNWQNAKNKGIVLAEGLATGASILDSKKDLSVVICFHGFNMIEMAKIIKENTNVKVYIASDIDKNGKQFSTKAKEVLGDRGFILEPKFTDDEIKNFNKIKGYEPNDFNDLYQLKGKEFLKKILDEQINKDIKKNFKKNLNDFSNNDNKKKINNNLGMKI